MCHINYKIVSMPKVGLLIFPFWTPHFFIWTQHFGWTPRLNYTVAQGDFYFLLPRFSERPNFSHLRLKNNRLKLRTGKQGYNNFGLKSRGGNSEGERGTLWSQDKREGE